MGSPAYRMKPFCLKACQHTRSLLVGAHNYLQPSHSSNERTFASNLLAYGLRLCCRFSDTCHAGVAGGLYYISTPKHQTHFFPQVESLDGRGQEGKRNRVVAVNRARSQLEEAVFKVRLATSLEVSPGSCS